MLITNKLLKVFYSALLTGMPSLTYNPINKNILHAPFTVNQYSTYINYKLNDHQINAINNYLQEKDNKLVLAPSSLINEKEKEYILSINIYNCTSPIFDFITNKPSTRCELNIYVNDKNNEKGTLIMDYASNILSLDPENLFKSPNNIDFSYNDEYILGNAKNDNFILNFYYNHKINTFEFNKLNSNLIKFTDKIYYPNGYYDKLYYDSSLIHNKIVLCNDFNIYFKFLDIEFTDIDSVFYFKNKINFVGGLWHNLYND